MNVREAVKAAKHHLEDAFFADDIINLGLEEIEYDELNGMWRVTLGFSRQWKTRALPGSALGSLFEDTRTLPRDYRVVSVRDSDGVATSIKLRQFAA